MPTFQYLDPKGVDDVVAVLEQYGERARCIAGGTDVLVQFRGRRFELDALVDIKDVPEAMELRMDAETLYLGAGTPCHRIYENSEISNAFPGIVDAASLIGGIQIQSRASLGGNLCNSSPSADGICPLIVHSAIAVIAGPKGLRSMPVEQFCISPGKNALENGEFLLRLEIPRPSENFGAAYQRFIPRNEMDIAVVGVAASVVLEGNKVKSSRISLAAVAPTPLLVEEAGSALVGRQADEEAIESAAKAAQAAIRPISDMRGTAEYRTHLVGVLTRRVLTKAIQRAKEK